MAARRTRPPPTAAQLAEEAEAAQKRLEGNKEAAANRSPFESGDFTRALLDLEDTLALRVIGQPEAVAMVADHIQTNAVGMQQERGPMGVFLFVGPTGVGKTELAKALAAALVGEAAAVKALLRVDMGAYKVHTGRGPFTKF
jgi:ATP-dependent Clp protease ATP-binding subunit ClpA